MSLDKDHKFRTRFLEIYRDQECLWWVKSHDYANKLKRNQACQELVDFSQPYVEAADIAWVKKKIQYLQTVFKKVKKSIK